MFVNNMQRALEGSSELQASEPSDLVLGMYFWATAGLSSGIRHSLSKEASEKVKWAEVIIHDDTVLNAKQKHVMEQAKLEGAVTSDFVWVTNLSPVRCKCDDTVEDALKLFLVIGRRYRGSGQTTGWHPPLTSSLHMFEIVTIRPETKLWQAIILGSGL